jgi:type IV pilus assembly protein PilO
MNIKDLRFDNLPRPALFFIFIALIGCLAFAYYRYSLNDLINKRDTIRTDITNLEQAVAQKIAVETRYKQFKEALARSKEQLAIRQRILPAEKETPAILRSIQQMAKSSDLTIDKFVPQPMIAREYFSDWPIQLEVQGTYNGLGLFFEKIGRAYRIINVGTISIKGLEKQTDPTQTLTASCTATTFVFNDSSAKPQGTENQKEKKR